MFEWKDFFDLAKKLVDDKINITKNEACERTAVSRAYYACFHKWRNFAYTIGYKPPQNDKGKEHREMPEYLRKTNNENQQKAGSELERLLNYRIICDYDEFAVNIKSIATGSLIIAGNNLNRIPRKKSN